MAENKTGLPKQPESSKDNDTTIFTGKLCPLVTTHFKECRRDCAWYIDNAGPRYTGCAINLLARWSR